MDQLPSGTVTFLFTDIEGSTQLARLFPQRWEIARARHDQILREAIECYNGFIFQITGDAFYCAFHTAGDALQAAIWSQHGLQKEDWGDCVIRVRMGLHTGEAQESHGEYTGYLTLSLVQRLMSAGHGGQVLVSGTTENLLREQLSKEVKLKDLGRYVLKDAPQPVHVFQLVDPSLPAAFPPLRTLQSHPNNLPGQLTSFVGREKQLAEVQQLLLNTHLLTLIGPGGTGKTRLSIQVASLLLDRFPDGLWFVELAPILDPLLVTRTVATTMGLRGEPQRTVVDVLCDYLQEKKILIILDNCEHLVDACAHLADRLLHATPNVRILASSREALGIGGEVTYRVPSLALPDVTHLPPIASLNQYEAVKLFIDRARAIDPFFSVNNENAPAVAQICHRLDGIPLAIELAAAKISVLSVEQIARRLDDRFHLLTGGSRTVLERHQTLRAAIDWSYNLLSPTEQVLFHRLSIFVGGWSLEAAESVCEGGSVRREDVLELLEHLIHKSLVIKEEEHGESRYQMLETIRQYAQEKLLLANEKEVLRKSHQAYFLNLAALVETGLQSAQQVDWLYRANREGGNFRAALEHARESSVEAGLYLAGRLAHCLEDNHEIRRWLTEFLERPEAKEYPHARAKALCSLSGTLLGFEQYHEAKAAAEEALAFFRAAGDPYGEVDSLVSLGWVYGNLANPARRVEVLEQALTLAKTLGDKKRQAYVLNVMGWGHHDHAQSFALWEQAIALYRQIGHRAGEASVLSDLGHFLLLDNQIDRAEKYLDEANVLLDQLNLRARSQLLSAYGEIALRRGDLDRAREYFQEDVRISTELGNRINYLWSRAHLGYVKLCAGDLATACQILAETARAFQKDGSVIGVVYSLEAMASLYLMTGKTELAAYLIGWADATREVIANMRPRLEQTEVDRITTACRVNMGEAAFLEGYAAGSKLPLDEAMGLAFKGVE